MNVHLDVQEKLGPVLSGIMSSLEGADRTRLSAAMGSELRIKIVDHLRGLGESRHTTASRLGADPTGFIANLAENFDQSSTTEVDEAGVSITMRHPTILRAYRDITITPKSGEFLTIPMNALAYGHRVGEFTNFILLKPKGEGSTESRPTAKEPELRVEADVPVYLLVREVHQARDPSLMPDADELLSAAALGAGREIKAVIEEAHRV